MAANQMAIDKPACRFAEWRASAAAAGLCLAWISGCGESLDLQPAEGVVTLDGQPVASAAVLFQPVKSGPSAAGSTDAQGHFQLRTANRPGVPLGEYKVLVSKKQRPELPRSPDGQVDERQLLLEPEQEAVYLVPERYSNPITTDLRAVVEAGVANRFTFSLASGDAPLETEEKEE